MLSTHHTLWIVTVISSLLIIAGCAGHFPVPGGNDITNPSFYPKPEDLLARLKNLHPGATEKQTFAVLGHGKEELVQLERSDIVAALYGSNAINISNGNSSQDFLQSLYGYRLDYKFIERKHGFASPIRIKTTEEGFDYAVTLIFHEGKLYAPALLTGGIVNRTYSRTFFDYLNPGTIIDQAAD